MNAWQVDAMWEAESARLWEELNASDGRYEHWEDAIGKVREALSLIKSAAVKLETAAEWTEGTGAENRIASLTTDLDKLAEDIAAQAHRMEQE